MHNNGLSDCDDCARSLTVLAGGDGQPGSNGLNFRNGVGAPSNSLGLDGEGYVDRNSPFNLYFKVSGAWVLYGQLKGIDGNGFYIQTAVTLTEAEILLLSTTPKVLIPAVPSTFYTQVVDAIATMHPGANPYIVGTNGMLIQYQTSADTIRVFPAQVLGASSQLVLIPAPLTTDLAAATGSAVSLIQQGSNPTIVTPGTGGTLTIQLVYHVWPVI